MIKDFQNEISKPIEINGTLYKFRPPNVDVVLQPELPEFMDEAKYKLDINAKVQQRINQKTFAEDKLDELNDSIFDLRQDYDGGKISEALYNDTLRKMTESENALRRSLNIINFAIVDLGKEWDNYDEKKMEYDARATNIKRDNKKALANYEDELRSRNIGLEGTQQPDESDEDYSQRMIDTAHTVVDPSQLEKQAELHLF